MKKLFAFTWLKDLPAWQGSIIAAVLVVVLGSILTVIPYMVADRFETGLASRDMMANATLILFNGLGVAYMVYVIVRYHPGTYWNTPIVANWISLGLFYIHGMDMIVYFGVGWFVTLLATWMGYRAGVHI